MSNIIKSSFISIEENMVLNTDKWLDLELEEFHDVTINTNEEKKYEEEQNLLEDDDIYAINKALLERKKAIELEEKNMRFKANEMIKDAGETAENIISAAKKQVAVIEEKAKKDGERKGYDEGIKKANESVEKLKENLKKEYSEKENELKKKTDRFEKDFIECLVSILEKMTGIIVEDKKDIILHIINREFNDMEKSDNYLIRVSKEDYELVNSKKQVLQSYVKEDAILEIIATDTLERNRCIIETDNSVIDCSLDTQIENLITELKLLSNL